MAAETHALFLAVDMRFVFNEALNQLLGREAEIEAYYNSQRLLNIIEKGINKAESRL